MLRLLAICILAAATSACWVSDRYLFASNDYTVPEGLKGRFISENGEGEAQGTVMLSPRSDGMIDGTVTRGKDPAPQTSAVGFVAIPGGSGRYFVMVQPAPDPKAGELYVVGRWKDERLEAFWPQCGGTPDVAGMLREKAEPISEPMCRFTSKEAVLRAALIAERELETTRLFEPKMLGRLKRDDSWSPEPEPDPEPEPADEPQS